MTTKEDLNRKLTTAFINENPVSIVLNRKVKTATADGGWSLGSAAPLSPQIFTKIINGPVARQVTREDGSVVIPTHALVGQVDADIQRDDTYNLDGKTYLVIQISKSRNDWALRAECLEETSGGI